MYLTAEDLSQFYTATANCSVRSGKPPEGAGNLLGELTESFSAQEGIHVPDLYAAEFQAMASVTGATLLDGQASLIYQYTKGRSVTGLPVYDSFVALTASGGISL
jgi:hypothetical protein